MSAFNKRRYMLAAYGGKFHRSSWTQELHAEQWQNYEDTSDPKVFHSHVNALSKRYHYLQTKLPCAGIGFKKQGGAMVSLTSGGSGASKSRDTPT